MGTRPSILATALLVAFFAIPAYFAASEHAQAADQNDSTGPRLGLSSLLNYAFTHSPSFDSQKRLREISPLQTRNARALLLPSLDLSASAGLLETSPVQRTTPVASEVSLSLSENLYDNGASWTGLKQARIQERAAEIRYQKDRDALALSVAKKFYSLQLSSRLEEARRTQLDLIRKQHRMVSTQYKAGMRTRRDFLQFEAAVIRAEIELVSAEKSSIIAREELLETIGVPANETAAMQIEILPDTAYGRLEVPKNEPSFENHYEARIASLEREVNALSTDLIRRKYWPSLDLKLAASQTHSHFIDTGTRFNDSRASEASAMLMLSANLWDWGIRRRNLEIARSNEVILGNTLDARLLTLRTGIRDLMLGLKQLSENFKRAETLLKIEQQSYDFINRQYREGKATYLDMTKALTDLLDAKTRFFTTNTELRTSLLEYRYHEGTLYDSLVR